MFVSRLKIQNWRSHKASEFAFGKVNLIRGPNASGKTSVAQALEFLLTGRCVGTDEAGRGGDQFIFSGAREAVIDATLVKHAGDPQTPVLSVERTRNAAGSNCTIKMEGRAYAGRQVEEFFSRWDWSKAGLSCVLRAGRFLDLPEAEQKKLLAEVLRPDPLLVPKEIRDILDLVYGEPVYVAATGVELSWLRDLEDKAKIVRAECTAALKGIGEPVTPPPADPKAATSKQIQAKLTALRNDQSVLVAKKQQVENEWAAKAKRIRELPELIAAYAKAILGPTDEVSRIDQAEGENKFKKAAQQYNSLREKLAEQDIAIQRLQDHPGVCPTCQQNVDVAPLLDQAVSTRAAIIQQLNNLDAVMHRYAHWEEAVEKLAAHREAIVEKAKLEKELASAKLPEDPKLAEIQERIDALEERIQKGQAVLAEAGAIEAAREAYKTALDRRKATESRRAAADELAKWAGPNGAQAQMTARKLPVFVSRLNSVLGVFGYDCEIELEPYRILAGRRVDGGKAVRRELGSLSESERWRFSLGFQAALAKATGVNCIVLDRADVLVGANRGTLVGAVLGLELDQVFLLASTEDTREMPPAFTVFDLSINDVGETIVSKGGERRAVATS